MRLRFAIRDLLCHSPASHSLQSFGTLVTIAFTHPQATRILFHFARRI